MTESVESTANVSNGLEQPTSNQTGASPVSQNSLDVDAVAAKVASILKPEFEKVAQSSKDKRFAKFEEFMKEFANPQAGDSQPKPDPTPQGTATATKVEDKPVQQNQSGKIGLTDEANAVLLKAFGLSEDDPALVAVKDLEPAQRIIAYQGIVARRNENPNPAATTTLGGNVVNKDALAKELLELQNNDPFDKSGRQAALKAQLGI